MSRKNASPSLTEGPTLNLQQRARIQVLGCVLAHQVTVAQVSNVLDVSEHHIWLAFAFRLQGSSGRRE